MDANSNQSSIAILADAKEEYTRQLINILRTPMYVGIQSIYNDAKTVCTNDNRPADVLMVFQDLLSRIPKWSQEIIGTEYTRITESSKCDWIEDLLKVIYVAHIKVLTIVNSAQKNKKISLKIPTGSHFTHLCYIELAREFWKNPYLFSDRVSKLEYQKNMRECEGIISNCIVETIRKQLPVRHILKEYFGEEDDTVKEEAISAPEDEDIKKAISPKYLKKIETIVKRELKSSDNYETGMEETIRQIIKDELAKQQKPPSDTKPIDKDLVAQITEKVIEQTSTTDDNTTTPVTDKTKSTVKELDIPTTEPTTEPITTATSSISSTTDTNEVADKSKESIIKTSSEEVKVESPPVIETPDKIASSDSNVKLTLTTIPPLDGEVSKTQNTAASVKEDEVKNITIKPSATKSSVKTSQLELLLSDAAKEDEANSPNKQEESALKINDITDVNLNLNELDMGDLDSELEEVNLEVKSDPNVEYKFF